MTLLKTINYTIPKRYVPFIVSFGHSIVVDTKKDSSIEVFEKNGLFIGFFVLNKPSLLKRTIAKTLRLKLRYEIELKEK